MEMSSFSLQGFFLSKPVGSLVTFSWGSPVIMTQSFSQVPNQAQLHKGELEPRLCMVHLIMEFPFVRNEQIKWEH